MSKKPLLTKSYKINEGIEVRVEDLSPFLIKVKFSTKFFGVRYLLLLPPAFSKFIVCVH